ncbi:MAG: hypothetical protein HQK49_06650 [Oligoflexia bacterium]|nr:hypothetical protein [Oligoflexia bacterium]
MSTDNIITFKPKFLCSAIGSLPYENADAAADFILSILKDGAPIWPQLSKLGLNEQMEIQYSEGIPSAVIDREKGRMFIDTASDYSEKFAEFYETYMTAMDPESGNGDCEAMSISEDFSKGIYAVERALKKRGEKIPWFKVQTTGPCSFALTIVDENKRAIFYNEEFRDVIVKALAMKCRWQIQKFKSYAKNIICFIDEPILSAFGSSTYISVKREDVVNLLKEVVDAIHADGALAGTHCCGNTEWSILVDAGVDIINVDAFNYGETISMYPDAIKKLFARGGMIAWGAVPTSKEIRNQSVETLAVRLQKVMDILSSKGIDEKQIAEQALITPSCGTGSMDLEDARRVFETTAELSRFMKHKYKFN